MSTSCLLRLLDQPRKGPEALTIASVGVDSLEMRAFLPTTDIFRDLAPDDIVELNRRTETRAYPKGSVVYSQDEHADALFLVRRGRVQLYRLAPAGKRLEIAMIEARSFFGEMPLLGESVRHTYAEAVEDSVLYVAAREDIERLIRKQPAVGMRMLEVLGQRLALCEARLEELAYRGVAARTAAVLLRLSHERAGQPIATTHQELGDMIGALRETVTKALDEFRQDGLVELGRGRITLLKVEGIRERLAE